jgi:hypothetical protein
MAPFLLLSESVLKEPQSARNIIFGGCCGFFSRIPLVKAIQKNIFTWIYRMDRDNEKDRMEIFILFILFIHVILTYLDMRDYFM